MWNKSSYFRSSRFGHDVFENKFAVLSLFRIAIGLILLREISFATLGTLRVKLFLGLVQGNAGEGGWGGGWVVSGAVQGKLLFSTRCLDNRNRIASDWIAFSSLVRKKKDFLNVTLVAK